MAFSPQPWWRGRMMVEMHSVSLDSSASVRFSESPCLKKLGEEHQKLMTAIDFWPPSAHTQSGIPTCLCKQYMYTIPLKKGNQKLIHPKQSCYLYAIDPLKSDRTLHLIQQEFFFHDFQSNSRKHPQFVFVSHIGTVHALLDLSSEYISATLKSICSTTAIF